MLADDTKIYTAVRDISDSLKLQSDSDTLAEWVNDWLLRFNVKSISACQLEQN